MRKLFWFCIGFCLACMIHVYIPGEWLSIPFAVLGVAVFSGVFLILRRQKWFRIVVACTLGVASGILWLAVFSEIYLSPLSLLDGQTISMSLTATDYSEPTRYSMAVDAITRLNGMPYKLRVYLNGYEDVEPGDVLEGDFRIRVTLPGSGNESSYERGKGVYLIAGKKGDLTRTTPSSKPIWSFPAVLSHNIKGILEKCFPEDTDAFAKALLLGDTSELSYSDDTALKVSGIRHIVAVSGLHVSILFGLIVILLGSHRVFTPMVTLPVLFLFSAMTGFTPSVTRASLMTGLMVVGSSVLEEYDGLTSLSFACLLMLAGNPYVVESVSFQLSILSVLGILLFADRIRAKLIAGLPIGKSYGVKSKIVNWVIGSVAVSISATIATTPLSAYYFGTVSLVTLLTNLLTLWIVAATFIGTALTAACGAIFPTVGVTLAAVISWFYRYILFAAKTISSIPFAAVYTKSIFIVVWLILSYGLLLIYCIYGKKHGKRYLTACAAFLILAIAASVWIPRRDEVRMHVLNVGEGQCILLQSQGKTFMIDCGGDSDARAADEAAQTLLSQGINHLDGIALTHYDRDHSGALLNLLTRVDADVLYLPQMEDGGFLETSAGMLDIRVQMIQEDISFNLGCGQITLTKPGDLKTINENCMCVLFESEKCDILVTGDRSRSGEKRLVASRDLSNVDILVAGHHGSKNSTSSELLASTDPEIVIISCGVNNSYGHPAQEVLDRLAEYACTVYRTDLDGSVLVRR